MYRFIGYIAVVAALFAASPLQARSGPEAPSIVGIVRDTAGAPLPNVQVLLSPGSRGTTTDSRGRFEFQGVRPGRYHLDATLIGYATAHQAITVAASGITTVEMRMRISAVELSSLEVTAAARHAAVTTATQATSAVSGKQLMNSVEPTIATTLAGQPGLSARYAGGAAAFPVIRGFTGERILVLQNGERSADLSSASSDHGMTVDPLSASRIEVVRGPASLLYGNNALGGVVNVITNDIPSEIPSHLDGFVAAQAQSVAPGGALSLSATSPLGTRAAVVVQGGGRRLEDVRVGGGAVQENTWSRDWHGTVGFAAIGDILSGGASAEEYHFEYGLPVSPANDEGGVHLEGWRRNLRGRTAIAFGEHPFRSLEVNGSAQWYRHDEIEATGEIGTRFDLQTQTLGATARTAFGRVTGQLGATGLLRQYQPAGAEALTPGANSGSVGVYLFQEVPLAGAADEDQAIPSLQFGARYDRFTTDTEDGGEKFGPARSVSFGNASGSLGINVPLGTTGSVALSVARAFRAPSVEELFSNGVHAAVGAFQQGNAELDAETNIGVDGVVRVQREGLSGQLAGYYNRIDGYIAPIRKGETVHDGQTLPLDVFEQRDARVYGVEGQIEHELARRWVVGAMGDMTRGDFIAGDPLPYMPAARLGGSLRWDDGKRYLGSEVRHAFAQEHVPQNEIATGSYTLVDLTAGLNLIVGGRVHSISLRADNLLDESYRDATSRIKAYALNPGRNLSLVYRVLF